MASLPAATHCPDPWCGTESRQGCQAISTAQQRYSSILGELLFDRVILFAYRLRAHGRLKLSSKRTQLSSDIRTDRPDKWMFIFIVAGCFLVFALSPVRRMGDSKYCLLVSQSLLEHGAFDITEYSLFNATTEGQAQEFKNPISSRRGLPYQVERHRKRLYYYFPPGSSILSIPFVALSLPFHKAPAVDESYSEKNERRLQVILGSALMAGLAGFLFLAARVLINRSHSALLAIVGSFGTMVWSTASRGLPSHTWGILLLTVVVYLLLKERENGDSGKLIELVLATILAWAYFVRPTFSLSIAGVTCYYTYVKRRVPLVYLATGAFRLVLFLLYSHELYEQWLPNYYLPGRVHFGLNETFWKSLAGVLFSPSRGLFIFVPTVFACFYLSITYYKFIPHKSLALVAGTIIVLHIVLISSFRQWWGGYSYGPRLLTDVLPWLFLLGILTLKAREDASLTQSSIHWKRALELSLISVLVVAALFIHGIGAWSDAVWKWNETPTDIDTDPDRLWDWQHPQFLNMSQVSAETQVGSKIKLNPLSRPA